MINYREEPQVNTLFSIADLVTVPEDKPSKFEFEYQQLCSELEPIYGKVVWCLPHRAGFTEQKIRNAHAICTKKGIQTISYLIGIVKRDKSL